jgi:hypothetical protein
MPLNGYGGDDAGNYGYGDKGGKNGKGNHFSRIT